MKTIAPTFFCLGQKSCSRFATNRLSYCRSSFYSGSSERELLEKTNFPAFENNLRELADSNTVIYQTKVRPTALHNHRASQRLDKYFHKRQARTYPKSSTEEIHADKVNAGIATFKSCQADEELSKTLSDLFHSEGGAPPQRLLSEAILCLGRRGDFLGGFAVIEQVRRRGLLSYLDGCTIQVYNSLLESTWTNTRDPLRLTHILNEMFQNSISLDDTTHKIVNDAMKYLRDNNQKRLCHELSKSLRSFDNYNENGI